MSAPSMVTRAGDALVIRSVVSGNQLYVNEGTEQSATLDVRSSGVDARNNANITNLLQDEEKDLPQCKVKRNYACNLCNYFTQNPRQHLHHLRDVHKEKVKIYECKDCLYASRHFQKLARHMRIVHDKDDNGNISINGNADGIKAATLRRPRKRSRRPMDEMYEEDYAESPIFEDAIDNEKCDVESGKNSKNKISTTTAKLKCSLCPFTTRHQGHLTRHERQDHIKTRFFRCVKCSYVTHIKARFTKHVKYHSMPMIKCDLCDFRTPYKWNLDRHNKNHNGHGAFKCCACNFTADIKQSLTVHEMNHHIPPVGQAAAAGLGVGRRRNKVGASDSTSLTSTNTTATINDHNDLFNDSIKQYQILNNKTFRVHESNQDMLNNSNNSAINSNTNNSSPSNAKKKCRPIPNLIPIQNASQTTLKLLQSSKYPMDQAVLSPINISQQDLNDLCAKSVNSSLRDFTSLFDDGNPLINDVNKFNDIVEITAIKNTETPKELSPQTIALQKKNASFFDKLKEKLMTNTLPGDENSLTCRGCGHSAKCLSEMASHQKTCGKYTEETSHEQLTTHVSSTRCQYCRQRCKSSADLIVHMQNCSKYKQSNDEENSMEDAEEYNNKQEPHPMENKVFVWNNIPETNINIPKNEQNNSTPEYNNSNDMLEDGLDLTINQPESSNSTEEVSLQITPINTKPITHGTDLDLASRSNGKRVFKCPHCSFWATTASRFHVHIVGHLNKKPFECSLCSYRSNWRWDITKHIRLKSVRDSAHQRAKVLMTDETGRRNYSKYNKYLIQMKDTMQQTTSSSIQNDSDRVDLKNDSITSDKQSILTKLPPGIKVTRTKIPDTQINESNNNEFKTNVHETFMENSQAVLTSVSPVMSMLNSVPKRSLWKCKKCNFRDENRQVLLQHVKGHYIQQRIDKIINENQSGKEQDVTSPINESANVPENLNQTEDDNDEASVDNSRGGGGQAPFRCGHCHQVSNWKHVIQRHCRLKHRGDIRVLIGGDANNKIEKDETQKILLEFDRKCTFCPFESDSLLTMQSHIEKHISNVNTTFKCSMCTFSVNNKNEFTDHLALHNKSETEHSVHDAHYQCTFCPYVSTSKSQFYYHKQFHRPRNAPYKCNLCNYNVTRRHLLVQHLKIHQNTLEKQNKNGDNMTDDNVDENGEIFSDNTTIDIPLVWVEFENQFLKMYKCRQCPQTNTKKTIIEEHEVLHNVEQSNKCSLCSFGTECTETMDTHLKYHQGIYGTIHCLVDAEKSDEEQIKQFMEVLGQLKSKEQSPETILWKKAKNGEQKKIIYFCDNCPARFLYKREYTIHMKFHNCHLAYRCPCCNYTARQHSYLLSHLKVHTEEYQEKSKILQSIYPTSENHKCPRTAILMDVPEINGPAWIVVSMNSPRQTQERTIDNNNEPCENIVPPQKYYRCKICPAKFFKFPALKYHKKLHGSNYPYKCKLCNYAAKTEISFQKHKSDHENIDSDPEIDDTTVQPKNDNNHKVETEFTSTSLAPIPVTSLYVDAQFGILMHGSPEFIYPTYIKNGRVKQKRYKCHKCPSAFEKREQYKTHLTLHGSKQKYRCKICDYSVKYYANYVQHLRKHQMNDDAQAAKLKNQHSTSTDEQSDESGATTDPKQKDKNHYAIKSVPALPVETNNTLKISVADRQALMILQQRRAKDIMKENSTDERRLYPCPNCPYANSRRDSIDNHIKRHISICGVASNYTCTYCDFSVPQTHFLREHVKLHFLPMKINKLESYMIYDKLQIWSSKVPSDNLDDKMNEDELLIFKDDSDKNNQLFSPPLQENEFFSDDDTEECITINMATGEVIFVNGVESNDTKDVVVSNSD